ncbi:MAG: type II secretion system F family protein [Anaerohalosphaeraceae bacterium]
MALFEYNVLTDSSRLMRGTIEAADAEQAQQMLLGMNLTIQDISKVQPQSAPKAVGLHEFLLFNQQLASVTKASIPLEKGLRNLAADAQNPTMRKLLADIACELEAGVPIEQAIEKRQRYFPPLYGMLLTAGIRTGRLGEMLTCLNRHLEIVQRTRRIIIESITYPMVVLILAACIITFMFIFIIPTFGEVLSDMTDGRAGLPVLTRTILTLSHYIVHIWIGIAVVVLGAIFIWCGLSATAGGRRVKETLIQTIPVLGRIYRNGILARLCEALGLLVDSGCPLPEGIRLAAQATGSEKVILDSTRLTEQLEKGVPVIEAGGLCQMLPHILLYSLQLGCQRNTLKENLMELSRMYAQQTLGMQARLQTLLLPLMIVGLGMIIGTLVLAMFLPLIKITTLLM